MSKKFEVGDRVVVDNLAMITDEQRNCGLATNMKKHFTYIGDTEAYTILSINTSGNPIINIGEKYANKWSYHPSWLRHADSAKAKETPVKKIKVKIKPMEEILRTVDPAFFKGSIKLLPSYFELMGTEIKTSVRYDAENDVVYLDEKSWHPDWVTLPKSFIIPDKKIRKDLCSYDVNVQADELKVGCQTITKEQELLWFKVLGKRLGYEIKG